MMASRCCVGDCRNVPAFGLPMCSPHWSRVSEVGRRKLHRAAEAYRLSGLLAEDHPDAVHAFDRWSAARQVAVEEAIADTGIEGGA